MIPSYSLADLAKACLVPVRANCMETEMLKIPSLSPPMLPWNIGFIRIPPSITHLTGVDLRRELHFTKTLERTGRGIRVDAGGHTFILSNDKYRVDYLHLTFGVPIDFYDQTSTRTVSTIPLAEELFDVAT